MLNNALSIVTGKVRVAIHPCCCYIASGVNGTIAWASAVDIAPY